jgi:homoserine O-acetyltransferase
MAPDATRFPGGSRSPGAFQQVAELGPFALELGAVINPLVLAYRHDGRGADAPQVLVVHALTGSADAAGDWWTPLIGPGRAFDTDRVGVLCANLLGGRYGSTGPTSIDPATGAAYGSSFPEVTARDEARTLWALADRLGIERFAVVTGGSLGGMVALEVGLERPDRVDHLVPIAAPAATTGLALAWNHIQLELIDRLGVDGLAIARQLAMTTYRSEADFASRFGRDQEADGRFSVASYLDHQGEKLADRFDPETYRTLVRVMDLHDIGRDRGGIVAALTTLADAGAALTGVGVTGDILYGPDQVGPLVADSIAAGIEARYREISSSKGHDAFLIEWDQLTAILGEALADGLARQSRHQSEVRAGAA